MKSFLLSSFSILMLAAAAAPAAQAQATMPPAVNRSTTASVTAFKLVSLAYQGFLASEDVPRFNRLVFGYREGQIVAEDLVRAAIATGRLPAETLSDRRYLAAVERQLESLSTNSHN